MTATAIQFVHMNKIQPATPQVEGSQLERIPPASRVLVLTAEGPLVMPVGAFDDPLERKRRAAWHNHARDQVVAEIAEAFADRNISALWDHGLLLDQDELPYQDPWPRSTTILVEAAEHGRVLAECLPEWDLLHAVHGKPGSVYEKLSTGAHGLNRRIVTLMAASKLREFSPDVLIVAMGGDWAFELPNFKPAADKPTLLVDVLDDFDDVAKRGSVTNGTGGCGVRIYAENTRGNNERMSRVRRIVKSTTVPGRVTFGPRARGA